MPSNKLKFALSQKERENLELQFRKLMATVDFHYKRKHYTVARLAEENHPCWGELRPYEMLVTLFQTMTFDEFRAIMQRACPLPSEPRQRPEPDNEALYVAALSDLKKKRRPKPLPKP